MKTPIAFITTACALLLVSVISLKAQVYNLNQAAGTISVLNEEYVDDMDMEWNINAGQNSNITFTYIAEMEGASYDYIDIYTVNSSGVPSFLLTIDAVEYEVMGTVTTTINSGRAKVVFVSDYMNSYDCGYKGFKIQFSASNSYTTPEMIGYQGNAMLYPNVGIGTLEPVEALDVNGNIRANGKIYAIDGYWGKLKISSSQGYIELNPLSSDYAYIKTDRSKLLFDKPIYLQNGALSAYSTSDLSFQTNGSARMTILSTNGNVGIGTLTPQEKLHVNGSIRGNQGNAGALRVQTTLGYIDIGPKVSNIANFETNNYLFMFNRPIYTTMGIFSSSSSSDLSLQTSGITRIKALGSNGNVGIGIDNPAVKLHLGGSIRGNSTNGSLKIESDSGYIEVGPRNNKDAHIYTDKNSFVFNRAIYSNTGIFSSLDSSNLVFKTSSDSTRMTILQSNGNVGIGTLEPEEALEVNGNIKTNGKIYAMDGYSGNLKISSSQGYIELNPLSLDYAYIKTDRSKFLFEKPIYLQNGALSANSTNNLSLQTNGTSRMTILQSNGNVGIGIDDPAVKLHLAGSIRGNSINGSLKIESDSGYIEVGPRNNKDAHIYTDKNSFVFNRAISSDTGIFSSLDSSDLVLKTNADSTRVTILQSNGNVGIGTTSPDYKLDVAGVIRCSEVLVQDINQIADFVFKPDYSLPSLQQVDEFISSNGHLPGIPSEAEVKENGMGLVEMQIKLLQKVEELTLYVIEQDKRALEQERRALEQEKRALEQEKRIKELEAELMNK